MEQNILRKGLINCLTLLVLGAAAAAIARYSHSATGLVSSVFLGMGVLTAAVSYFQMRLYEREELERLEHEELRRRAASESLFEEEAGDLFPARQARLQFEKYFVPFTAVLLLIIQGLAVYFLWDYVGKDQPSNLRQATVAMALNGLFALLFFQFGKYSAVFARLENQWLLRPQAAYLLLGALLTLLTAAVEAAGWSGRPELDPIVARGLLAVLALVGAENLVRLLLEAYRPRVRGAEERPLYESRLIGMLSQPGGIIRTVAQALDYQFGFKVSETWFYRFLEKTIGWFILLQLTVLELSTCFVVIPPGEGALLERFGRPAGDRNVLEPGLHVKWPWPIDHVYRYRTDLVQVFTLGRAEETEEEKAQEAQSRVLLWTRPHAKQEFNMLVASRQQLDAAGNEDQTVPVNLLSVAVPVHYQIRDLKAYVYNHRDAGELLKEVAGRELTKYLVSVDLYDVMGPGRRKAAEELLRRIQAEADRLELGVKILFVGLHGIHPPVKVAPEFEKVIGAIQDAAATNHYARAYAAETVPKADAEGVQVVNRATAYRTRLVSLAKATAERFLNQEAAYQASPSVYPLYMYLDTVSGSITNARIYVVVPTNANQVVQFNLEDEIRPDLLDVTLPGNETQGQP